MPPVAKISPVGSNSIAPMASDPVGAEETTAERERSHSHLGISSIDKEEEVMIGHVYEEEEEERSLMEDLMLLGISEQSNASMNELRLV